MKKQNNYIDEIMKELKERRDWKNPKEVETFFEQKLKEAERRKMEEIIKELKELEKDITFGKNAPKSEIFEIIINQIK